MLPLDGLTQEGPLGVYSVRSLAKDPTRPSALESDLILFNLFVGFFNLIFYDAFSLHDLVYLAFLIVPHENLIYLKIAV